MSFRSLTVCQSYNVPCKLIYIIKELYRDSKCNIKDLRLIEEPFLVNSGVQ